MIQLIPIATCSPAGGSRSISNLRLPLTGRRSLGPRSCLRIADGLDKARLKPISQYRHSERSEAESRNLVRRQDVLRRPRFLHFGRIDGGGRSERHAARLAFLPAAITLALDEVSRSEKRLLCADGRGGGGEMRRFRRFDRRRWRRHRQHRRDRRRLPVGPTTWSV
jgi:hypothetical protein